MLKSLRSSKLRLFCFLNSRNVWWLSTLIPNTEAFSALYIFILSRVVHISAVQTPVKASGKKSKTTFPFLVSSKRVVSRSEEHTSELQSRGQLVCRLLLEKK